MTIPGATTSATSSDPRVVCPLHPRMTNGSMRPALINRGRRATDRSLLGLLTVLSLGATTGAECKGGAAEDGLPFGPPGRRNPGPLRARRDGRPPVFGLPSLNFERGRPVEPTCRPGVIRLGASGNHPGLESRAPSLLTRSA